MLWSITLAAKFTNTWRSSIDAKAGDFNYVFTSLKQSVELNNATQNF